MVRRGLPTFRAVYDHLKKDALSFFAFPSEKVTFGKLS